MKHSVFGVLFIAMIALIVGCADYNSVDYSGDIVLQPTPTHEEGLKKIGEFPYATRVSLSDSRFFAVNPIFSDYLDFLMEDSSRFTSDFSGGSKEITLGGEKYIIHALLRGKGRIVTELQNRLGRLEGLHQADGRETGDPWWQSFDMDDLKWTERWMSHNGSVVSRWECDDGNVFIFKTAYEFEALCRRRLDSTQDGEVVNFNESYVDLNLKMMVSMGYATYLTGEKTFSDKRNNKVTITVSVIDQNFDGRFNADDGVDVRISDFLGFSTHLPCGKPVLLNSRIKERYILTVKPTDNGMFILTIKKAG